MNFLCFKGISATHRPKLLNLGPLNWNFGQKSISTARQPKRKICSFLSWLGRFLQARYIDNTTCTHRWQPSQEVDLEMTVQDYATPYQIEMTCFIWFFLSYCGGPWNILPWLKISYLYDTMLRLSTLLTLVHGAREDLGVHNLRVHRVRWENDRRNILVKKLFWARWPPTWDFPTWLEQFVMLMVELGQKLVLALELPASLWDWSKHIWRRKLIGPGKLETCCMQCIRCVIVWKGILHKKQAKISSQASKLH